MNKLERRLFDIEIECSDLNSQIKKRNSEINELVSEYIGKNAIEREEFEIHFIQTMREKAKQIDALNEKIEQLNEEEKQLKEESKEEESTKSEFELELELNDLKDQIKKHNSEINELVSEYIEKSAIERETFEVYLMQTIREKAKQMDALNEEKTKILEQLEK